MKKSFGKWLSNTPINKKFTPLKVFVIVLIILVSLLSITSVIVVNSESEKIIEVNVDHREQLNAIIRNMYVCRVLGRDILLHEDMDTCEVLYDEYIIAFDELDYKMDVFADELSGDKLTEFESIIDQKNIYKDSMILSADIKMEGGAYQDALYALQVVTPIANEFFGSIDDFLSDEQKLMDEALIRNDAIVMGILMLGLILNAIFITALVIFIRFFAKNMSSSLIALEHSVSEIAGTGNMKVEIPQELYTKDEVGRIATVVNDLRSKLLVYSFLDSLTGGFNAKAYHEEIADIFSDPSVTKQFWCIIADMNNLKLINDNLGHVEGDGAIRKSYESVNDNMVNFGKTYRVGGDEFVSLINCDKDKIKSLIVDVNNQIEKSNTHKDYRFSLAIGYDEFIGNTKEEYDEFFKTVDKKMYENKLEMKAARLNARIDYIDNR